MMLAQLLGQNQNNVNPYTNTAAIAGSPNYQSVFGSSGFSNPGSVNLPPGSLWSGIG
jgi:hypothetical protein